MILERFRWSKLGIDRLPCSIILRTFKLQGGAVQAPVMGNCLNPAYMVQIICGQKRPSTAEIAGHATPEDDP